MIEGLSDTALLRIAIVVAALVLFLVIWLSARRKSAQGKRVAPREGGPERSDRTEPTLRELIETGQAQSEPAAPMASRTTTETDAMPAAEHALPAAPQAGSRPNAEFDKIVSVYLVARAGQSISGPDLVVAAEKAGLVY